LPAQAPEIERPGVCETVRSGESAVDHHAVVRRVENCRRVSTIVRHRISDGEPRPRRIRSEGQLPDLAAWGRNVLPPVDQHAIYAWIVDRDVAISRIWKPGCRRDWAPRGCAGERESPSIVVDRPCLAPKDEHAIPGRVVYRARVQSRARLGGRV